MDLIRNTKNPKNTVIFLRKYQNIWRIPMRIEEDIKLDYSDVLIRPKRSELISRKDVSLKRAFTFKNGVKWTGVPIVADQFPIDESNTDWEFVCLDVANGYSQKFIDFVKEFRKRCPEKVIIAGNVVTAEMTEALLLAGADIIKVGIGPGSVCTTRKVAGVGYPQLSAVIECADAAHGIGGFIMADGGCQSPGDVAKAFGAGADFVMLGGMLAGHEECAGELVTDDSGASHKVFYGMSSTTAMDKHSGGVASYRASEGKTVRIPYRGPVEATLQQILGGVRSACTYTGARTIKQLPKCTTFVRVNRQLNTVFGNE
jgi:GMP reductase